MQTTAKTSAADEDQAQVPDGYDSADAFLQEARERFAQGSAADRDNREAALDDLRFFSGEQWDPQVRAWRQKNGRACLTVNRLPQFVAQVVGDIRINQPAISVKPAKDATVEQAQVREGLIRFIERQSSAQQVYANAGQAQVTCGLGHFRAGLQYADDDVFDQDVVISHIPNPFAVVWDPLSVDPTGKDAEWCFVSDEMPRAVFDKLYPGQQPSDLGSDLTREGWADRDVVRVSEYWLMQRRKVTLALLADGTVRRADDVPAGTRPVRTRRTWERYACRWLITGTDILDGPYELPVTRLPIFRVSGWEAHVADRRVRWGLVRFAKDSMRNLNLWRSVSADLVAGAPRQQWLAQAKTVEGREEDFREAHLSGDPLLVFNDGTEPPQRLAPPPIPAGVLNEAQLCSQDLKDVTGLHDASLGIQSNETSGVAINARQREGDVATYVYHDNLHAAIAECGRVVNELIPVAYDTARTVLIIGADDGVKEQRINDPAHPESIDLAVGKYDISVETGPAYSTRRAEAAASMIAAVQAYPQLMQVAGDIVVKAQDWPLAPELAERLKQALPPQLQDHKDAPAPSPQQQQAQQQQAMLAQAAAALEMRSKQADAAEKEARARKTQAEAAAEEFALAQATGARARSAT